MKDHAEKNSRTISRRNFIAAAAMLPALGRELMANNDNEFTLYAGTYTSGRSKNKGIYMLKFDARTGVLSAPMLAVVSEEPSFLAVSRNGKYLYSANETLEFEGKDSGFVSAFAVQPDGTLKFLNRQASGGAAPCHLTITDKGDLVLVANYLGGNVAAFPVNDDGTLEPASDIKQHTGKGTNPDRQEAPHCHSVILDKANRYAVVDDLGIDRVTTYAVDRKKGTLTAVGEGYAAKPGSGPRHFKFHPNGKLAVVNFELNMTVTSLAYDARTGVLAEIQTLSTLPEGYKGKNLSVADLHVSHDGRFLYVSTRGHDSIASYAIDEKTGMMTPIECVKTGGIAPRNFALDPTGNFLLAANQNSSTVTIFRIDRKTGKLTPMPNTTAVPSPVCLIFAQ